MLHYVILDANINKTGRVQRLWRATSVSVAVAPL